MDRFSRKLWITASLGLTALLAGCVAYPVGGGGYYPAPYYSPPAYAFVAPPVIGFWGGRGGGYGYGNGYGHHWR